MPLGFWFTPINKKLPKMFVKVVSNPKLYDLTEKEIESLYFTSKILVISYFNYIFKNNFFFFF